MSIEEVADEAGALNETQVKRPYSPAERIGAFTRHGLAARPFVVFKPST